MNRVRYGLPEAARKLGWSLGELCERIAAGSLTPQIYPGDIEVGDGEWIHDSWRSIINTERFIKLAGHPEELIRVLYRAHLVDDPKLDPCTERTVRLSRLTLPGPVVDCLAKDGVDCVESDDRLVVHSEDFRRIRHKGKTTGLNSRQAEVLRRLVENFCTNKNTPLKSQDLVSDLFQNPLDGRFAKIFDTGHLLLAKNGGFIETVSIGYYHLSSISILKSNL